MLSCQAYKSVTLASMAASFGVSEVFLDGELSRFIAAGRLHVKVDKVGGVVETNRPDAKNSQYHSVRIFLKWFLMWSVFILFCRSLNTFSLYSCPSRL